MYTETLHFLVTELCEITNWLRKNGLKLKLQALRNFLFVGNHDLVNGNDDTENNSKLNHDCLNCSTNSYDDQPKLASPLCTSPLKENTASNSLLNMDNSVTENVQRENINNEKASTSQLSPKIEKLCNDSSILRHEKNTLIEDLDYWQEPYVLN